MVFGIFIDVPLLVVPFVLMIVWRKKILRQILRIQVPPLLLCILVSIPLIIFEEQIDCMPAWCGKVVIPPTLPFLAIEIAVLGGLVVWAHAKNLFRITIGFAIYGVSFELLLGGLVGAPLIVDILLGPWVALGYSFISMLPVAVLTEGRKPSTSSSQSGFGWSLGRGLNPRPYGA
jgi:hypothetical protein